MCLTQGCTTTAESVDEVTAARHLTVCWKHFAPSEVLVHVHNMSGGAVDCRHCKLADRLLVDEAEGRHVQYTVPAFRVAKIIRQYLAVVIDLTRINEKKRMYEDIYMRASDVFEVFEGIRGLYEGIRGI